MATESEAMGGGNAGSTGLPNADLRRKVYTDDDFRDQNAEVVALCDALLPPDDPPPDDPAASAEDDEEEEDSEAYFAEWANSRLALVNAIRTVLLCTEAEANILVKHDVLYPSTTVLLLEPVSASVGTAPTSNEKTFVVCRDFNKLVRCEQTGLDNQPSFLLPSKLLSGFARATILDCPDRYNDTLRKKVSHLWDKPCTFGDLAELHCASLPGSSHQHRRELIQSAHSRGDNWFHDSTAVVDKIGTLGFTNGTALCLRGQEVLVQGALVKFPFSRPGAKEIDGTIPLRFPLLDAFLDLADHFATIDLAAATTTPAGGAGPPGPTVDVSASADCSGPAESTKDAPLAAPGTAARADEQGPAVDNPAPTTHEGTRSSSLSTDTSEIQLGSAFQLKRPRIVLKPAEESLIANLAGIYSQEEGFFGPSMDAITSNRPVGLFYRCMEAGLEGFLGRHPNASVTTMVDGGEFQELGIFVKRVVGSGLMYDSFRAAGRLCEKHAVVDTPKRNRTHDLCVFPPCAGTVEMVMDVMAGAKSQDRMVLDKSAKELLEKMSVAKENIPSPEDPALAFSTMSSSLKKTLAFAKQSTGFPMYVHGCETMSAALYAQHLSKAKGRLQRVRKGLREKVDAVKNKNLRVECGEEEVLYALNFSWASESVRVRAAAAAACLIFHMNVRPGVLTGLKFSDVRVDIIRKATAVSVSDGVPQRVEHDAVRMEVDIYTYKHGDIDGRGRALGSSVFDRQDRSNCGRTTFTCTSSPDMPVAMDAGIQMLRLWEAMGRLDIGLVDCLVKQVFPLRHHVFVKGIDCPCRDAGARFTGPPPLDAWERTYRALKPGAGGYPVVCKGCKKQDIQGTYSPSAIKDMLEELAIPGTKSSRGCAQLVKALFASAGMDASRISPYSMRRWNSRAAYRECGRDGAVDRLGHDNDRTVNVYNSAASRQAECGLHSTVGFVGQGGVTPAEHQWTGGAIYSLLDTQAWLECDMDRANAFPGSLRYCRLTDATLRDLAALDVVQSAETNLLAYFDKSLPKMNALIPESKAGQTFSSGVFKKQGWATAYIEGGEQLLGDDTASKKKLEEIVEDMELGSASRETRRLRLRRWKRTYSPGESWRWRGSRERAEKS